MPAKRGRGRPADRPSEIAEYGAIGNLHTAALVSRYGSIDWACLPHFASPSAFARLLDWGRGGYCAVRPPDGRGGEQRYIPSTNVLVTSFGRRGREQLRVTDFMPIDPLHPARTDARIVRRIEAPAGPTDAEIRVAPRFRYGAEGPTWQQTEEGWVGTGSSGDRLVVRGTMPASVDGEELVLDHALTGETPEAVELSWDTVDRHRTPEELELATRTFWTAWIQRPTHPFQRLRGRWHDPVQRSELVLKLLSHADSGAFVAAPTTSLPEWPGGERNWDYRYIWIRDSAFTAQVLARLGHFAESLGYLRWVIHRMEAEQAKGGHLHVLYDGTGRDELPEHELELAGYQGSRPVRIGNGAGDQRQLDIYGEVFDAISLLLDDDPGRVYLRSVWPSIARLADTVVEHWRLPDSGLWESRGPPAQYVHSKLMCWVALDRAGTLAEELGFGHAAPVWKEEARTIASFIVQNGFNDELGSFVQAVDSPQLDAAALRIPLVGFLPFEDARVRSTVHAIEHRLAKGPFVWRYRGEDGLEGEEGAFLACSFWLAECLARMGEVRRAREHWRALLAVANPLGLYSEEYDPRRRKLLGNYPQAFTHIAALRAAVALGHLAPPRRLRPATRPRVVRHLPGEVRKRPRRASGRGRRPRPRER